MQTRFARLEKATDDARLLRELERVITAHGMIELRGALVMLLERLENHVFEIGMFGRVSSGKLSLLNHLLGSQVLPVGVTPVTAFPTRVSYGAKAQAIIEFAEDKPQTVELSRLPEFATEQQNPGNAKHVMRISVQVPARRLREGVTFVDTPGLARSRLPGRRKRWPICRGATWASSSWMPPQPSPTRTWPLCRPFTNRARRPCAGEQSGLAGDCRAPANRRLRRASACHPGEPEASAAPR